jgi:two-component system sensor histidine kinase QseC
MTSSIRRRLLVALLFATTAAWAVMAVLTYRAARSEVQELFDAQLAQSARVLLALTRHEMLEQASADDINLDYVFPGHRYENRIAFRAWRGDGVLVLQSASAAALPAVEGSPGFADVLGQDRWRVFTLVDADSGVKVEVGERHDVRDELIAEIAEHVVYPFVLLLPVLGGLIWWGVGRGLRPLRRLASDVGDRQASHLDPLDLERTPDEVAPLVRALNRLFARLARAFESERRFTADAAHELRTPLAALKTQAQVALRASDDDQRAQALAQLVRGIDRASRLVQQLLTLARLDPDVGIADLERLDLKAVIVDTVAELIREADSRGVDVEVVESGEVQVVGSRDALGILVRNLLENALRYVPRGGRAVVEAGRHEGRAVLTVCDNGPGIPTAERSRVFERFHRGVDAGAPGSGLGLSIVRRIVELHHASIELSDNPREPNGLCVRVEFGGRDERRAR